MFSLLNGWRSYRPDLAHYIYPNETFRKQVDSWVAGVKTGNATRALLLTGGSGLGKTTLAQALAGELGVAARDLMQINGGANRTVADAESLLELFYQMPLSSPYRIFILDEVHKLTETAQEIFLTPLEELPKTTIVIGCTSQPTDLKPAFRNRFYELKFDLYSEEMILDILSGLPGTPHSPGILARIARVAGGVPRTAIALVEKNPDTPEMQDILSQEILTVERFMEALFSGDTQTLFVLSGLVKEENKRAFFDKLLRYLECIWALDRGLQVALSSGEREFIKKLLIRGPSFIAWLYNEMLEQSQKSVGFLKGWIMSGALFEFKQPGTNIPELIEKGEWNA